MKGFVVATELLHRSMLVTGKGEQSAERPIALLRLEHDGVIGWGEIAPLQNFSLPEDTVERALAEVKEFRDLILDPALLALDCQSLLAALDRRFGALLPSTRMGIEAAVISLAATQAGKSLTHYLSPAASGIDAAPANGFLGSSATIAELDARAAAGFSVLKLKIFPGIDKLPLSQLLSAAAARKMKFRLDANQSFEVAQIIELFDGMDLSAIDYLEEPLICEPSTKLPSPEKLRTVKQLGVQIGLDETLLRADAASLFCAPENHSCWDVAIVKPTLTGGISRTLHIAPTFKKPVVITSTLESGIGVATCLHLAVVVGSERSHGLDTLDLFTTRLETPPLTIIQGMLTLPKAPGLGVQVDTPHNWLEL